MLNKHIQCGVCEGFQCQIVVTRLIKANLRIFPLEVSLVCVECCFVVKIPVAVTFGPNIVVPQTLQLCNSTISVSKLEDFIDEREIHGAIVKIDWKSCVLSSLLRVYADRALSRVTLARRAPVCHCDSKLFGFYSQIFVVYRRHVVAYIPNTNCFS